MPGTDEHQALSRPHRRSLRRIFNGRSVPIVVAGRAFLTYRDASGYLESLAPELREAAFAAMTAQAK